MRPIFYLTLRALVSSRRLLAVAGLLLVPILLALAYAANEFNNHGANFAIQLFAGLVLPILLPLTALLFATSALGGEVEDRTLVYLTLKPVARLVVVVAKYLAAVLITTLLVEVSLAATYLVAAQGAGNLHDLWAILLAGLVGCLAYTSLFLLLGLWLPRRGLLVGFIYVLVWEGTASNFSTALAALSVRRYVQGGLHASLGSSPLAAVQPSSLSGTTSFLVLALVLLAGIIITTWKLHQLEQP